MSETAPGRNGQRHGRGLGTARLEVRDHQARGLAPPVREPGRSPPIVGKDGFAHGEGGTRANEPTRRDIHQRKVGIDGPRDAASALDPRPRSTIPAGAGHARRPSTRSAGDGALNPGSPGDVAPTTAGVTSDHTTIESTRCPRRMSARPCATWTAPATVTTAARNQSTPARRSTSKGSTQRINARDVLATSQPETQDHREIEGEPCAPRAVGHGRAA